MAEQENQTDTSANEGAQKGKSGRMILAGFISLIMVVETALFFFLVPSAEDVAALAEARLIQNLQENENEAEQAASDENKPTEFQLGTFGETFKPIDADEKVRVEFRLFGLVRAKNLSQMETDFKAKEGRLRHEIRKAVRNSEISELEENTLGLLQRRILATCNHLLEDDFLISIGFTDYQVFPE